jgi:glycosyltransferase involved in cell wall biosynthesis
MVPGVSRISSFLTQFKVIFEQVVRWCDVVVLYSVPTNGLQTLISSRFGSKPLIFHSFDVLHRMTEYDVLRFPTWALERLVYSRADRIIVISESLRSYMKEIGIHDGTIILLPPAVNMDIFNPSISGAKFRAEIGLSNDDQIILFSGWLYEFSGVDLVMNQMRQLMTLFPRVKLVICGDGPLLTRLRLMSERLGLQDHVRILGRRAYAEMPQVVAAADICVNPYLAGVISSFAFPSKIVEYMASGKAVIASDLPGTRSLLDESSGVVLVRPSQLGATLVDLLATRNRRIELGQAARQYCEANFSLDSVAHRFEGVLKDALDYREQRH